jgi:hypothetical protein
MKMNSCLFLSQKTTGYSFRDRMRAEMLASIREAIPRFFPVLSLHFWEVYISDRQPARKKSSLNHLLKSPFRLMYVHQLIYQFFNVLINFISQPPAPASTYVDPAHVKVDDIKKSWNAKGTEGVIPASYLEVSGQFVFILSHHRTILYGRHRLLAQTRHHFRTYQNIRRMTVKPLKKPSNMQMLKVWNDE